MSMRTGLAFIYDRHMQLVAAKCKLCGERMPKPRQQIGLLADRVLWLSQRFLEHKKLQHTQIKTH